jgi:hypothetical protein
MFSNTYKYEWRARAVFLKNCPRPALFIKSAGGWLPIKFSDFSNLNILNFLLTQLISPALNRILFWFRAPYYYSFVAGGSYKLSAKPESNYSAAINDGGIEPLLYEAGSNKKLSTFQSGLVLYLPFDEGGGTIARDLSGFGNNGTLLDASSTNADGNTPPQWTTGKVGGALSFDGVDDYVSTSWFQNSVTKYTITAWVKVPTTINVPSIIVYNRGITATNSRSLTLYVCYAGTCFGAPYGSANFGLDSDGIWRGVYSRDRDLRDDNWHHVVGIFSSDSGQLVSENNFKMYVDGRDLTLATPSQIGWSQSPLTGRENTLIGRSVAWNGWFRGLIDEVRIYNRALSDAEIQALYNATK